MFLHRHHSFFPLALALLTLGLIMFMYFSFTAAKDETKFVGQTIVPVSSQEYKNDLKKINDEFIASYEIAETDTTKLFLVEKTLGELLALRVPAEFKSTHLELAVLLNQMQTALRTQKNPKELFDSFKNYVSN